MMTQNQHPQHLPQHPLFAYCRESVWQAVAQIQAQAATDAPRSPRGEVLWPARQHLWVEERQALYQHINADAAAAHAERDACRGDILRWFRHFAWGYDPRPLPLPATDGQHSRRPIGQVPFLPYAFQAETILRVNDAIAAGEDVMVEKSRDMGLSWLVCHVFVYRFLLHADQQFLIGSRNAATADTRGDLSSLLEKCRFILKHQPQAMLPKGFRWRNHDVSGRLLNPENGNTIVTEAATENFARGGRYTAILMDEFAFWGAQDDAAYAASGQASPCRVVLSTPNGRHNRFAIERFSGYTQVLSLHWRLHPERTDDWYEAQCKRMMPHEVARELDIDYEHSNRSRIYEAFGDKNLRHNLKPVAGKAIMRVWDFGYICPAVLFMQVDVYGRVMVLREVVGHRQVLSKFAQQVLEVGRQHFGEHQVYQDYCDPAGKQHNDKTEVTSMEILNQLGIYPEGVTCGVMEGIMKVHQLMVEERLVPLRMNAESKAILSTTAGSPEQVALKATLEAQHGLPVVVEGGKVHLVDTAFLVDAHACPTLVRALEEGYRFRGPNSEVPHEEHPFEDVADCLRYGVWAGVKLLVEQRNWELLQRRERQRFIQVKWRNRKLAEGWGL